MPRRIEIKYYIPSSERPIDFSDKSSWEEVESIYPAPRIVETHWAIRADEIIKQQGLNHQNKEIEERWNNLVEKHRSSIDH